VRATIQRAAAARRKKLEQQRLEAEKKKKEEEEALESQTLLDTMPVIFFLFLFLF